MNKRKILAIAIIVLLGALIVGGTSAYFTFSDTAHNIITTSGVAIELIEDTDTVGADGRPVPFTNVSGVMPGDKISKIPKIRNVDVGDVYVRMHVTASVTYADGTKRQIPSDTFGLDISRSWSPSGEYYYYMRTLHAGETTNELFSMVTIPLVLAEEYQNASFALDITAEAVQAANNGTNVFEAQGWPEE